MRTAAILLLMVMTACHLFDSGDPETTTTGESTSVPTGGTTETGPCERDDQCPYPGGQCMGPRCEDGVCGGKPLPDGTLWSGGTPGDCRHDVCDGAGGLKSVLADDPPQQTPGDCERFVCEGGEIVAIGDASDVPNDGNDCTDDACVDGVPTNTQLPVNTACGGGFCHDDAVCRACKQVSDACEDAGPEPHENQETAFSLGSITDADATGSFQCGVLKGGNDVDWYTFFGKDALLNQVDPSRSLYVQGGAAQICVYFECTEGTTQLGCNGATSATAPLGQEGCCGTGTIKPSLNCTGLDDSARVWIKVDNTQDLACVPYQLDYHF